MGEEESYEVCIVGAGLAGSTLAYNLAQDSDVCIVEKRKFEEVGSKPCGDAVHKTWFDGNGVEPKPAELDAVASRIKSIELDLPEETMKADLPPKRELLTINREKFIKNALKSSLDHGCDLFHGPAEPIFENGGVRKIEVGNREITAETYVDASGAQAILRKEFLPNNSDSFFRGYREIIDGELKDDSCHVLQTESSSAFWAFPRDGTTNVGGVAFRGSPDLRKGVQGVKKQLGLENGGIIDAGSGSVPSHKPIDLVHDNMVAVGDAGLTANPVTGGGIGPSIKASNILEKVLTDGMDLSEYQKLYLKKIASNYERNYYLSRLLLKLQKLFWKRAAKWAFQKFYGGEPISK